MSTVVRSLIWLVVGVVIGVGALLATRSSHGPEPYVLRSYDVNPEIVTEIHHALQTALLGGNGQVSSSPTGQLLVTAAPATQESVKQMLADIAARKPTPTPSLRFEAWLVAASSGEAESAGNLAEVEPALRAIKEAKGRVHFELLEKLSTQIRTGQGTSEIQGQRAALQIRAASLRRDSKDQAIVAAQLELKLYPPASEPAFGGNPPTIKAQTELRAGELLVLGQSNVADKSGPNRELYYIVRASL
jgi:hypothetical protein